MHIQPGRHVAACKISGTRRNRNGGTLANVLPVVLCPDWILARSSMGQQTQTRMSAHGEIRGPVPKLMQNAYVAASREVLLLS